MASTPKPIRRVLKRWKRDGISWAQVSFVYGTWLECNCGYEPHSQRDMNRHTHRRRNQVGDRA